VWQAYKGEWVGEKKENSGGKKRRSGRGEGKEECLL